MHAWRRRVCEVLTLLVFAHGAWLFCRNFGAQWVRLRWALHYVPAGPLPGGPRSFGDFTVFWLAGRLSAHPALLYKGPLFLSASAQMMPHASFTAPFIYPPPALPLLYLISRLPLAGAYYAFMAGSILAAVVLLRRAGISWLCIIAGLLSPAGLWCMYLGQYGILCGGVLLAGLAALESRPVRAGVLFGLLCIKPQYLLLAPIIILARRNYRALLGAGIAAAALLAVSGLCFGGAWGAFLGPGMEAIRGQMLSRLGISQVGISVFWMMRSLGAGLHEADALQAVCAAFAAIYAWQLWSREDSPRIERAAITLCLALLATPYGYAYDMVGYSFACVLLMRRGAAVANLLLALLWHAPADVGPLEMKFGLVAAPLCIFAVILIGWWRLRETSPASRRRGARRSAQVLSLAPGPFHRFR
jgi:hypothetical protein